MKEQFKMVENMYGRKIVVQATFILLSLGFFSILGVIKFLEILGGVL